MGSCCSGHNDASVEEIRCPVMPGSIVDKEKAEADGLYRDYQGTRYWLCCSSCGPLFDANPERYVSAA